MTNDVARVGVIPGDGSGPELMAAARRVLAATGVRLDLIDVDVRADGLDRAIEVLRSCDAVLKGPLATAQDGSEASPNIAIKQRLGLHTQVRRIRSLGGRGPVGMDVHIVRQATEGLLSGLGADGGPVAARIAEALGRPELADAAMSIAVATEAATRRTAEVAVEVVRRRGAAALVVAHKAAAVRHRDGLFVAVVGDVAAAAGVTVRTVAVDAAAARLVTHPTEAEVIVAPNLYGDVLSDVAGAVAGSVATVAGVNLGETVAVFEAAHGVVARHAGNDTADPTGLLLSAAMLLDHLGFAAPARAMDEAVADVIASGDVGGGTSAFAAAVAERVRSA